MNQTNFKTNNFAGYFGATLAATRAVTATAAAAFAFALTSANAFLRSRWQAAKALQ